MTETNKTNKIFFANSFYQKAIDKTKGTYKPLNVRILARNQDDLIRTTIHTHFVTNSNGKKRPINFTCPKGATFKEHRDNTYCPVCEDIKRKGFFPPTSKFYVWAIDLDDNNKIKWLELTYSQVTQISTIMDSIFVSTAQGGQEPIRDWGQQALTLAKSGVRLSTAYVTYPKGEPLTYETYINALPKLFELNNIDPNVGLPQMIDKKEKYPAIIDADLEFLEEIVEGKEVWKNGSSTPTYQNTVSPSYSFAGNAEHTVQTTQTVPQETHAPQASYPAQTVIPNDVGFAQPTPNTNVLGDANGANPFIYPDTQPVFDTGFDTDDEPVLNITSSDLPF